MSDDQWLDEADRLLLYERAEAAWGQEAQFDMAVEEFAELIVALHHLRRGRSSRLEVAEELADAAIMIEQVCHLVGITDIVKTEVQRKAFRLRDRLDQHDETMRRR